jgi:hypothetical protein
MTTSAADAALSAALSDGSDAHDVSSQPLTATTLAGYPAF